MIRLAYIGGLGLMAGPAAKHLKAGGPAECVRVHDRGKPGKQRDLFRKDWTANGAKLVDTYEALIDSGDLDGVVICCGKNGDDIPIVAEVAALLNERCDHPAFIMHMSTVSAGFSEAAHAFCGEKGIDYVNYPLTGGPLGAELGGGHPQGMLILASGNRNCYGRLEPVLKQLGHPRYFGESVSAGAEMKLIGHHMVYNGCVGISTAAALHSQCFADGKLGGSTQADQIAFLNGGAGGTRQWDVALKKGIKDSIWDQGFGIKHAVVDAIYAAKLAMEKGLPRISIQPIIHIALAFSFILNRYPEQALATHAIAREFVSSKAAELDTFMFENDMFSRDTETCIERCIASLPAAIRKTVMLDVSMNAFKSHA